MPTSQLFWNDEKKTFEVEITNRKGETKKIACDKAELSADLPKTLPEEPVEVEFERDLHGKPLKVRLVGKEWIATQKKPTQVDYSRKNLVTYSDKSKFTKGKDFKPNQPRGGEQTMNREFHNPYNFVPAPERNKNNQPITGELGDREPCGHDRYYSDKYSGKLHVKMRVETPLLLPDTARMIYDNVKEHKSYPVRVDADGKPFINPTAIKGMLRSTYEAITNSRMSVFTKHEDRLAFRPEAGKGASVVPVRIEEDKHGNKILVFYTGTNKTTDLKDNGSPKDDESLCAAWLPRYKKNENNEEIRYKSNSLPSHKDEVEVWIEKFKHYKWKWIDKHNGIGNLSNNYDFILWRVREVVKKGESLENSPNPTPNIDWEEAKKSYYESTGEIKNVSGFVFVSNYNMQSKHDEKIFFKNSKSPKPEVLTEKKWNGLKEEWRNLIENYQELHKDELDKPPANLKISEWSRHINTKADANLEVGTLCYAQVSKNNSGDFVVEKLFPVMISRQLFDRSPLELIQKDSQEKDLHLIPAKLITQLSPADRVFGWVRQGKLKDNELSTIEKTLPKEKKEIGAYRGQIRFGEVTTNRADAIEDFDDDWLPLNILGQPKPQQGRFYVAETQNGEAQPQNEKRNNEDAGYNAERGLRGRKVYPHHSSLPDNYWVVESDLKEAPNQPFSDEKLQGTNSKVFYREYIRPGGEKQRNNQNRSFQGWVKKGTEFSFDIHFTNLSDVELGALVWLLDLGVNHFHRFGGGKPFGFGSVNLSLKDCDIRKGEHWKEFYTSLEDKGSGKLTETEINKLANAFRTLAESKYPTAINSFLRACEGFKKENGNKTDLPVHYPRTGEQPNAEGKNYIWFVDNSSNSGFKLALPNLLEDEGLPRKPKN